MKLYTAFVPKRILSERANNWLHILFCVIGCLFFTGMIVGLVFLLETEGKSVSGWLLFALGVVYAVTAIVVKIRTMMK